MTITQPVYATRETVKRALDIKETARVNDQVDRLLEAASRAIDGDLHRTFYPRFATIELNAWDSWLNDKELISITSLTYGGTVISPASYTLSPVNGPPFNRLEVSSSPQVAFTVGGTVVITGLFGYTLDLQPVGTLATAVNTSVSTLTVTNGALVGIGDLLIADSEYLLVTGRGWIDSGQNLQVAVTASVADNGIVVSDGTAFAMSETILLGTEQCWITDIAGNTLIVKRAWDGSVLAAHTGSDVFVSRLLSVSRGVVGSAAAAHALGAVLYRWVPPPLVTQRCIGEVLTGIEQEQSAYARVVGSGESSFEARGVGLIDLRDKTYTAHGRKSRMRSV